MRSGAASVHSPANAAELAGALAEAQGSVRVRGAGTKLAWAPSASSDVELSSERLDRVLEHNTGDLTAVLEAGVRLAHAQEQFREAGQMLAIDPPDPGGATIGGVVAAADSGPLRGRYGGVRDLVVGIRVALGDGTIAKSGGRVIKNVAGYDLAKLFAGSFGRLGAILEVSVRLHPLPPATATAVGRCADPDVLAAGARAASHAKLEQLALDVRWEDGQGAVLSRLGGAAALAQSEAAEGVLREAGLDTERVEDDADLWQAQRDGQRSATGLVVKVGAGQTDLPALARLADAHGATLVGRAALGLFWLRLDDGDHAELARAAGERHRAVVLDHPPGIEPGPHDPPDPGAALLARRVKEHFDPSGTLV